MRIGEVARRVGTTVRTIRYYEEIGLMPGAADRVAGAHRVYDEDDVEQLAEVLRLKELLGVSLDELQELVSAQDLRRALREEFLSEGTSVDRRLRILDQLDDVAARQLALVDRRRAQLDALDAELLQRREKIAARRAELRGARTPV